MIDPAGKFLVGKISPAERNACTAAYPYDRDYEFMSDDGGFNDNLSRFILIPVQDPTGGKMLVYYDAVSFNDRVNRFTYDGVVIGHDVACFYSISHCP